MRETTEFREAARTPAPAGTAWRPDIQGLRAVAVGLVVAAHAGVPHLSGGFIGVDVFFVISGYLITGLLLREHERTGRIGLGAFYVRRARRILPAATFVLCAVLVAATILLPRTRVAETAADAGWSAVFLANWRFAAVGTDYFSSTEPSLLQHYWSLAVEEQFYLLWPLLLIVLLPRLPRRAIAAVAGAVLALSLVWSVAFTSVMPAAAYFNTPARAYELAAGALLACLGRGVLRAPWRGIAGMAGAALLIAALALIGPETPFPGWHALLPVAGTVLLLAAGPACLTGRLLSLAPLRWIGDISFSLYLWHWPAILLIPVLLEGWPPALQATVAVVVAVLLAAGSYHAIEVPFQRRRVPGLRRERAPLLLWPASLVLVTACAVSSVGAADYRHHLAQEAAQSWFDRGDTTGFTRIHDVPDVAWELKTALRLADEGAPIPPTIDGTALTENGWDELASGCYADDGETSADDCTFGDEKAKRTVALVGDSHAAMWLPALDRIGAERGFRVKLFAKISCAHYPVVQPAKAMTQEECDAFRSWTNDRLAELSPDTVLVTARGALFMTERDGVTVEEQWSSAVTDAVARLHEVTDDVRVLGDVPTRPGPAECLTAPDATQSSCVSAPVGLEADTNAWTAEAAGDDYVDTTRYVCVDDRCPLVVDEYPTYEDDSHLSAAWVTHIAPRLAVDLALAPAP